MSDQPIKTAVPQPILKEMNLTSQSEFETLKRSQIKAALEAMKPLRWAAYYTPCCQEICSAHQSLEMALQLTHKKNWNTKS